MISSDFDGKGHYFNHAIFLYYTHIPGIRDETDKTDYNLDFCGVVFFMRPERYGIRVFLASRPCGKIV